MPDKANDPDDRLTHEIVKTSEDLIERSRRLMADLDTELNRRRRLPFGERRRPGGEHRRPLVERRRTA
jgi:hypothetical protein